MLLYILGVAMLSMPYLVQHSGLLILMGLVPLFTIDRLLHEWNLRRKFMYYYLMFFLWNLATTFWIWRATIPGAIAAVLFNSLQMTVIYYCFTWFRKKTTSGLAYLFLIFGWLAWEHIYFDTEISWPWLTLGNAIASAHKNIQWYEYTGVLGGSLWILVTNIMIFEFTGISSKMERFATYLKKGKADNSGAGEKRPVDRIRSRQQIWRLAVTLFVIHFPFVWSQIMYDTYNESKDKREILVLQPNIDPYNEKFEGMGQYEQDIKLIDLAKRGMSPSVALIVAPETFTSGIVENVPWRNESVTRFREFILRHPSASFIFGATTFYFYVNRGVPVEVRPDYTARRSSAGEWYDAYNSAVFMDTSGVRKFYHKSKLVVMVEYLPYPQYLTFVNDLAIDLGGTTGSLGTQPEREIFIPANDTSLKVGTAICYESVYGNFFREYILKGANLMTIITNDGWWGDTPGYRQHLNYARLRAIETRRSIARSANTGISALINEKGDIVQKTEWWKEDYLKGKLTINNRTTLFVKYGDFIGRCASYSLFLFIALALLIKMRIYGKEKV